MGNTDPRSCDECGGNLAIIAANVKLHISQIKNIILLYLFGISRHLQKFVMLYLLGLSLFSVSRSLFKMFFSLINTRKALTTNEIGHTEDGVVTQAVLEHLIGTVANEWAARADDWPGTTKL